MSNQSILKQEPSSSKKVVDIDKLTEKQIKVLLEEYHEYIPWYFGNLDLKNPEQIKEILNLIINNN